MTRINVVPVEELCNQHLFAEFRELTRIPNMIVSGKAKVVLTKIPKQYTLGTGHVTFFYNKLGWLRNRYKQLHQECLKRGYKVTYIFPDTSAFPELENGYNVTPEALEINRERIQVRMPVNARWEKV